MHRLHYGTRFLCILFMLFCSGVTYADNNGGNIDWLVKMLVQEVKTKQTDSDRQIAMSRVVRLCGNGGAGRISIQGIDAIASLLEDDNDFIRSMTATALGDIGPPAKYTIPLLQKALKKAEQEEEQKSDKTLGLRSGISSVDTIPGVINKLN